MESVSRPELLRTKDAREAQLQEPQGPALMAGPGGGGGPAEHPVNRNPRYAGSGETFKPGTRTFPGENDRSSLRGGFY